MKLVFGVVRRCFYKSIFDVLVHRTPGHVLITSFSFVCPSILGLFFSGQFDKRKYLSRGYLAVFGLPLLHVPPDLSVPDRCSVAVMAFLSARPGQNRVHLGRQREIGKERGVKRKETRVLYSKPKSYTNCLP
jgi:hypothetical protein